MGNRPLAVSTPCNRAVSPIPRYIGFSKSFMACPPSASRLDSSRWYGLSIYIYLSIYIHTFYSQFVSLMFWEIELEHPNISPLAFAEPKVCDECSNHSEYRNSQILRANHLQEWGCAATYPWLWTLWTRRIWCIWVRHVECEIRNLKLSKPS
jgi:hypothetical protein